MFNNSKFDGSEDYGFNKDLPELERSKNSTGGYDGCDIPQGLSTNNSSAHLENDFSMGSSNTLRSYLNNFEDDYEPFTSFHTERLDSVHFGRTMRSMSVADASKDLSKRYVKSPEFHSLFNSQERSDYLKLDKNGYIESTSSNIKFQEIDCNFKLDKNNLKNIEQTNTLSNEDIKDAGRIDTKEETMETFNVKYASYSPKAFEEMNQGYSVNKSAGGCLMKSPLFFENNYQENQASLKPPILSPTLVQVNHFETRESQNQKDILTSSIDQTSTYCFPLYSGMEQNYHQSNNLFRNRSYSKFPFSSLSGVYKKRSYSEADLSRNIRTRTQQNIIDDTDFMSLHGQNKLSRSSSETCIDPRTFYKNECHSRIYQKNKENLSKPNQSYAQMITRAISSSTEGKLSLGEIYKWIEDNFEYYRFANPVWKNSIRHNLSLSKCFKKVPREPGSRGKGGKWMIDKEYLYLEENKKKRRSYGEENEMFRNTSEEGRRNILPGGYLISNMPTAGKYSGNKYEEM